jgi:hypothetical protein
MENKTPGPFVSPSEEKVKEMLKKLEDETQNSIDSQKAVVYRSRMAFLKSIEDPLVRAKVVGKLSDDKILAILNEFLPPCDKKPAISTDTFRSFWSKVPKEKKNPKAAENDNAGHSHKPADKKDKKNGAGNPGKSEGNPKDEHEQTAEKADKKKMPSDNKPSVPDSPSNGKADQTTFKPPPLDRRNY